jgi:hypothetical protein
MPAVEIEMWGGEAEYQVFATFTGRHPRFPLVQRKRWGQRFWQRPINWTGILLARRAWHCGESADAPPKWATLIIRMEPQIT